jgi:predicted RNase H-like nuclease (RuvC/YqgF family)
MKLITKAKARLSMLLDMLKTSERIDRLEKATFDQLDSALTRIEELEYQLDYRKKEINRLESRLDYVEEIDMSEAVSDAISDLDMGDYIDTDDIVDSVLAAIAERISEGVTR